MSPSVSEHEFALITHVKFPSGLTLSDPIGLTLSTPTDWTECDLHLAESRIFLSANDESSEDDRDWISQKSILYVDIEKAVLDRDPDLGCLLRLDYFTGSRHRWNKNWTVFCVSDEEYEQLRTLLPSMSGLSEKVEIRK
jgi:hypothetical protein